MGKVDEPPGKNLQNPVFYNRRSVLKTLALGVGAAPFVGLIPLQAAQHVHATLEVEKAAQGGAGAAYQPKFFNQHEWQTLRKLCEMIIPPDEKSGGALEANAPEFIDLLTSENQDFQTQLGGGLLWLDVYSSKRQGKNFSACSAAEQKAILDVIAYKKNSTAETSQGIRFFSLLRRLTADGFYTSKIGIADVEYVGNTALSEFPGCPAPPEA